MKTRIQKLLVGAALVCAATLVHAQFNYTNNGDGTCTITGYTGPGGAVIITNSINGLSVVSIGNDAFYNNGGLNSVTIPDSVTNIGIAAFGGCYAMTAITVDAANSFYSSANGVLFDKNQTTLIEFPAGRGGSYTIPTSVTSIGDYAFEGCKLTSVTIPASVTSIGDGAFEGCSSLTSVTISVSVTSIGYFAFANCTSLTNVTIPDSVSSIGDVAFANCSRLTSVIIPGSVTSIGEEAFYECRSLTSVTIPGSVTNIGHLAFSYCTSLTSVTIPNSVTSIGSGTFEACTSLTAITVDAANSFYSSVYGVLFDKKQTALIEFPGGRVGSYTIPNGVVSIGDDAFDYCSSLTSVIIPASVTSIGYEAFYDCSVLTSVTIPGSVTTLGGSAFGACYSLTNVTIASGVTSIGYEAFSDCPSLTSVTIPGSVVSIGDYAFDNCSSLTSVTIRSGVTSIGEGAFVYCSSLTSVTIPASVTSIGDYAFAHCYSLRAAYFLGNAPSHGGPVFGDGFGDADPVIVYYLPGATGWGPSFGGRPPELWNPQASALGVTGGHFGFNITGPSNTVIVVEACTNLAQPVWLSVSTNALDGSGASSFSDSQSGNYPARSYRFRSP